MNKKGSFRMFLTMVGRGIKQAVLWLARLVGYKRGTTFGKTVWGVFAASASVVMLTAAIGCIVLGCALARNAYRWWQDNRATYCDYEDSHHLSRDVLFHRDNGSDSYVFNITEGRRTLKGVDWIRPADDGDSLVCFSKGKLRGYFSRLTGKVVIPAQYERAWMFSEGLAAVVSKGELLFIDHEGRPAIDKRFRLWHGFDDGFHDGMCPMRSDEGRMGMIDKRGQWAVEPIYESIYLARPGYWAMCDSAGHWGVMNSKREMVLPFEYDRILVHEEKDQVMVRTTDHIDQLLRLDGSIVNVCCYDNVEKMTYPKDETDAEGDILTGVANNMKYCSSDFHYGLMDGQGNIVTPPRYSSIYAIAANRYVCDGDEGSVILDDSGRECGRKP